MEIALALLAALVLFVGYHAYKKHTARRTEESEPVLDEEVLPEVVPWGPKETLPEVWPPEYEIEEVESTHVSLMDPPSEEIHEVEEAAKKPVRKPKIKIAKD
jgi:hypothetical protein